MEPFRPAGRSFGLKPETIGTLVPQLVDIGMEKMRDLGRSHGRGVAPLLGALQHGRLSGSDDTGSISAGPQGFRLTRGGREEPPQWELDVSLPSQSASLQAGAVGVGGSWSKDRPSGFLSVGPVRLEGGYNRSSAALPGNPAGAGGWGQVSFQVGNPDESARTPMGDPVSVMDRAVAPFVDSGPSEPQLPSARDVLDAQLQRRRSQDPNWFRP